MSLYRITSPRFCAGVEVTWGRITRTAPCYKWMLGGTWTYWASYIRRAGWKLEKVL